MTNKLQVSVIIPTHNRSKILKECLDRLLKQNIVKSEYEIIVVDDGSSDNTEEIIKEAIKSASTKGSKSHVHIKELYQKNQGQGIARNYGLRYAKGKIVIIINDDILVRPDFIKQHLDYHRKYTKLNEAVLGFVTWDPRLDVNSFMEWMTNGSSVLGKFGGHQFAFEKLEGKKMANFNFFYTANISLKKDLLKKHPFDDRFSSYGWEDIELGYRLTKKEKLKLYYNPQAIGYHYHPMKEYSLKKRMQLVGKSAHLIHKKYPELKIVPSILKKFIFILLSNPISLSILKTIRNISHDRFNTLYFYALSKKYFLEGLKMKN